MSVAEKLTEIAENVPKVYDAGFANGEQKGYEAGHAEGYSKGTTDGARSADNRWWQRFQKSGNRTNYDYAFSNADGSQIEWHWNDVNPVYAMVPTTARYMFAELSPGSHIDLVERLDETESTLDFSKCEDFAYMLTNSGISHIGEIDASSAKNLNYIFYAAYTLKKVDKLIVNEGLTFTGAFSSCMELTDITIQGKIAHSIQLHRGSVPLSAASIKSFITHLSYVGGSPSISFALSTIRKAFGSETSESWQILTDIAYDNGWTIELK